MLLQVLDYIGVAVFALSGGIVAARKKLDFLAFVFFATATGIGGGTLRDLLLDVPVFWVVNQGYLIVCFVVSVFLWFLAHWVERLNAPLRWADAVGISAYSVMGAAKALSVNDSYIVAILMGILTATFGGVLRDTIAQEPSAIIKKEIYVSATAAGASAFVLLSLAGVPAWPAAAIAVTVALTLRGGAILRGWRLPGYKTRD